MRVAKHRNRLPEEAVKPPSLEIFKTQQGLDSPVWSRRLNWMNSTVSSYLNLSMIQLSRLRKLRERPFQQDIMNSEVLDLI